MAATRERDDQPGRITLHQWQAASMFGFVQNPPVERGSASTGRPTRPGRDGKSRSPAKPGVNDPQRCESLLMRRVSIHRSRVAAALSVALATTVIALAQQAATVVGTLDGHTEPVYSVSWSPDGKNGRHRGL